MVDTICALSSAAGKAGVAVVRISGPRAREVLERLAGEVPRARVLALRRLVDPRSGDVLDTGLVARFDAPASFTGEDVAELSVHGGRAVIEALLGSLRALGCRMAEPGEFARRAFDNGKIDLTEAEGLADLIDAETQAQRRQAVRQADGALFRLYEAWRRRIVTAQALTEAAIDFSDEADVAGDAVSKARETIGALVPEIERHLADGHRGEILREGFRVVLAGPPNAGKSSLVNALARREAAIVSAEPGTTRDVIEVRLDLEGLPVIVTDTAGIHEARGEVEREGIRRAIARGREADLVIWMSEATGPPAAIPAALRRAGATMLMVLSKVDLVAPSDRPRAVAKSKAAGTDGASDRALATLAVSARTGEGLAELQGAIARLARERIAPDEAPVITQARHREAVEACLGSLSGFLAQDPRDAELAAEDLRQAGNALGRIVGRIDAEQVLDVIFARFCIGK